jgi:GAF domain-containing protein
MDERTKMGRYDRLLSQLTELLQKSSDPTAQMATVAAVLYQKMDHYFWCGFYRIVAGELVVGPYQGPVACQVLKKNIGVCWAGINEAKTIVVPDVHAFPGHIACDSRSKSEIVVPIKNMSGEVIGVLDVDSDELNAFDRVDAEYLEKIVTLITIP